MLMCFEPLHLEDSFDELVSHVGNMRASQGPRKHVRRYLFQELVLVTLLWGGGYRGDSLVSLINQLMIKGIHR